MDDKERDVNSQTFMYDFTKAVPLHKMFERVDKRLKTPDDRSSM
jgi:hypothetical protein